MNKPLNHILCIDDESDILEIVKLCLETVGGYHVTACRGGADGIAKAQAVKPDLILIDVMMPDMDGPTTLKEIRSLPDIRHIPVIFMTARVQITEVAEYIKMGGAGVVAKPFDPMTLSSEILSIWESLHAV